MAPTRKRVLSKGLTSSGRQKLAVRTETNPAPITAHVEALRQVGAHHRVHPQVQHLQPVVPGADGEIAVRPREVQARHLPAQQDLVGRLRRAGPRVPEADLLVVVGADDGEVGGDHVVADGAGVLGGDAGLASQVPDFQGSVVASAHHAVGVGEEFGRHDLAK